MKSTEKRIRDMLQAIEAIEGFMVSSYEVFLMDEKTQDAIM